jgi:putative tryptophan/tyrosine transport system substrate-binding protein
MTHRTPFWVVLIAGLLLAAGPERVEPQEGDDGPPTRILLLASDDSTLHQRILSALERQLRGLDPVIARSVAGTAEGTRLVPAFDCARCLIVTSGVTALRDALDSSSSASILSIAIPEESFEQISASRGDPGRLSAIYMDVSLVDMLRVVDNRLRDVHSVGIVTFDGRYLERERARGHVPTGNPRLREYQAGRPGELVDVFEKAGRENQVLLALPHPEIYNRDTIVRIMLTTYRTGTPMIGYSEAMNHAGALMSVFASPEILGEDAGQTIATALINGRWDPLHRHTARFNVIVNQQVARSLRIQWRNGP